MGKGHYGRLAFAAALVCASAALAATRPGAAPPPGRNPAVPDCDRACLTGIADQYMEALKLRDPSRAAFADKVRFSENNVALMVGDGAWGTITGRGATQLTLADPQSGTVGLYGAIDEHGVPGYYALRLKVEDRRIAEVETMINRAPLPANGGALPWNGTPPMALTYDPAFNEIEPAGERLSRERLIDLANGYFSTLQQNDGTLLTNFAPDCQRVENGIATAGIATSKFTDGTLSCGEQFKKANYRGDSGVRDRDYMVVDEERQLVMTRMFLDHNGVLTDYKRPDGSPAVSQFKTPSTLSALELFKFRKGQVYRIVAVYINVPYKTRSVWAAH